MGFLWEFYGVPWVFHGFSMGVPWVFYGFLGALNMSPPVFSKTSRRLSAVPSDRGNATTPSGNHEGRPLETGGVLQMGVPADVEIHTIICLAGIHRYGIIELSGAFPHQSLPGRWNWGRISPPFSDRNPHHSLPGEEKNHLTTFFGQRSKRIVEKNEEPFYFFSEKKIPDDF
jgi:hypothetical protein